MNNPVRSSFFETEGVAVCRGCGCDDLHACPGGCAWAEVDRERGTGLCSRCAARRAAKKPSRKRRG